jgi:hypothetical protein
MTLKKLLVLAASYLIPATSCTGGSVALLADDGGLVVPNYPIEVVYQDCSRKVYSRKLDTYGNFYINPVEANGDFDWASFVPAGPVIVTVTSINEPEDLGYVVFDHEFDHQCAMTVKNQPTTIPCSGDALVFRRWRQGLDAKPPPTYNGMPVKMLQEDDFHLSNLDRERILNSICH